MMRQLICFIPRSRITSTWYCCQDKNRLVIRILYSLNPCLKVVIVLIWFQIYQIDSGVLCILSKATIRNMGLFFLGLQLHDRDMYECLKGMELICSFYFDKKLLQVEQLVRNLWSICLLPRSHAKQVKPLSFWFPCYWTSSKFHLIAFSKYSLFSHNLQLELMSKLQ